MRRVSHFLVYLLFAWTPAMAADLYWSSCSHVGWDTGCALNPDPAHTSCSNMGTTIGNPVCPDGNNDGLNEIYGWFQDGTALEAGPGDTIWLCAGACDGNGNETVLQERTVDTTSGGWRVTSYPGDYITFTGGSTNGSDGLGQHVAMNSQTHTNIQFDHYGVEHYRGNFFYLGNLGDGTVIDNMRMQYLGTLQTDAGEASAPCPSSNIYAVYMQDKNKSVSTVRITNNTISHLCKFALRCNNLSVATEILYQGNELYNMNAGNNDFDCNNLHIYDNRIWDVSYGLSIERQTNNAVVRNNTIECRGTYALSDGCNSGILFNDKNLGGCPNSCGTPKCCDLVGQNSGHLVEKNTVIGSKAAGATWLCGIGALSGCMDGACAGGFCNYGVNDGDACTTNADCACDDHWITIQNNILQNVRPPFTNAPVDPNIGCRGGIVVGGIGNAGNYGAVVRNNTLYTGEYSINLGATAPNFQPIPPSLSGWGTGEARHIVSNNLISNAIQLTGVPTEGIHVWPSADQSVFTHNNVYCNPSNGNAVEYMTGADFSCANVSTWGTGNICAVPTFVNTSGSPSTWNLHLDAAGNAGIIDSGDTSSGPSDDIDGQSRPPASTGLIDIGADELVTDTVPPKPPANLRVR